MAPKTRVLDRRTRLTHLAMEGQAATAAARHAWAPFHEEALATRDFDLMVATQGLARDYQSLERQGRLIQQLIRRHELRQAAEGVA